MQHPADDGTRQTQQDQALHALSTSMRAAILTTLKQFAWEDYKRSVQEPRLRTIREQHHP
ncbi:hypothetical protein [Streptomyces uncialis]|uniref:hypothetical protein n=1 Tax=Streptomyces uncialis TaxID=1048205 RepID=UPI00386EC21E|nr:hypothetical protein OG924_12520 [Streptomyces uncialis]